ncbi:uncharacterized protein LOC143147297 [Ptiloglossa arizonensis]|uniref:uncharacterized protein LOC143147297 n=1 Tax=Ptiloglossa arizonensis TaxID=3350558 RepID=UPI003FA042F7
MSFASRIGLCCRRRLGAALVSSHDRGASDHVAERGKRPFHALRARLWRIDRTRNRCDAIARPEEIFGTRRGNNLCARRRTDAERQRNRYKERASSRRATATARAETFASKRSVERRPWTSLSRRGGDARAGQRMSIRGQ